MVINVFLRVYGFAHSETIVQAFVKMPFELGSSLTTSTRAQMFRLFGKTWIWLQLPILSSSPYVTTVLTGSFHCAGNPHTLR